MLSPQLGSMCHTTLGGPVNNGFSREQLVLTWNSKRRPCISVCVRACIGVRQRETGPSTIWRCGTIPDEAENLEPFFSACWILDGSVFLRRGRRTRPRWWTFSPGVYSPHIWTGWNKPLQSVQHPVLKWIDPKQDQRAKSSLFIERLPPTD